MKLSVILALLCLGLACTKEMFEENNTPKTDVNEQSDDSSEAVVAPVPVVGSYLFCQEFVEDRSDLQTTVSCRLENGGEVIGSGLSQASLVWHHSSQGSPVKISMAETRNGWLQSFKIEAEANAIQTNINVEVSFNLGEAVQVMATKLSIIWNPDCALVPIDFESITSEQQSVEGLVIDSQFSASHGVSFSTLSGDPVLVGQYGGTDPVAYYGGPANVANYLAPGQSTGEYFITDGYKLSAQTDTLVVTYLNPAREAYLELIDVDFAETFMVRALGEVDQVIAEVELVSNTDSFRDGVASPFSIRSPDGSHSIYKLHVFGSSSSGADGIGFGVDNFHPRCILDKSLP